MEEQAKYGSDSSASSAPEPEWLMTIFDYATCNPISEQYTGMGFMDIRDAWQMFRSIFSSNAIGVVRHKTGIPETTFSL